MSEKYTQAIGAAISVVDEEAAYHIYNNGFDLIVPVIVVDPLCYVDLLKVPVNDSLIEAIREYGYEDASMAVRERSSVEIFQAGQIGSRHGEAEKKLEVYRHLEAFKKYVLDLNHEFVAHRDPAEAKDWENRLKLQNVRGDTPCNVDSG